MSALPQEAAREEPLLVFVHIRKTAGKTLRQIFYRQYKRSSTRLVRNYFVAPGVSLNSVKGVAASPPPDLQVVHGHMLFWPDVEWPEGTRFFTFLRDPVERAISHYFWLRARNPNLKKTLEEALTDGSMHDDLQTRVLSASMPPFGKTTAEMLESAIKSLDRLTLVGLTERFDETLVLMTRAFGWRRMLYRRENVTPDRKAKEDIGDEALELVKRYNALDVELYAQARERFEREISRQDESFHIEVAALKRANAAYATEAEGASLGPLPSSIAAGDGPSGEPLDHRELLIEAQADLLRRDAEIERLTSVSTPRAAARVTSRATKSEKPLEDRGVALASAAEKARQRVEEMKTQIEALGKEDGGNRNPAELEALRQQAAIAERRLRGFERRHAKIQNRLGDDQGSKATRSSASAEAKAKERPQASPAEPGKKPAAKTTRERAAKAKRREESRPARPKPRTRKKAAESPRSEAAEEPESQ